ncbi:MAG: trigger factor [Bacillota bacterium]
METKINVVSPSEHELEVTLGYEEIQSDLEKAYQNERKKIELPGFRKGKVPLSMLKKMFGDAIENQASERIAGDKFYEIVDAQGLKPISTPRIVDLNFERDVKLYFKIRYEVKPKLELKDYTGQEVQKIVFTVDEEQVQSEIDYLLRTNSTTQDSDVVEDKNSILTVDLQRLDAEGKPVEGIKSNDLKIDLTQPGINPQITENSIGKKSGETFTFQFQDEREVEEDGVKKVVPEDIKYEAVIKSIHKIVLPEFNEEFVKKITKDKFTSPEDWKENMRSSLQKYYDAQTESMLVNKLRDVVVKNNDFEPPHGYVHNLLDRMVRYEEEQAKKDARKRFDANEAHNRLHETAEWTAKWQIIMENLAEKESLEVKEEELKEMAEKESAETGISVDKLLKYYNDINRSVALLEDKVIDFLKKNNNIKEVNAKDLKNPEESTTEQEG